MLNNPTYPAGLDAVVHGLKAAADPTRLRLLALLSHGELAVHEICEVLAQSQPRVSRHLRLLVEAGFLDRFREQQLVYYRAPTEGQGRAWWELLRQMLESEDPQLRRDRERMGTVIAERARAAAAELRAESPATEAAEAPNAAEDLAAVVLEEIGPVGIGALLDVGTGTGRMAALFAPHSRHVTAFDKSPEMLRIARARLQHLPPDSVELVKGDFTRLPFADAGFDTVLFHQVLHYAQEPEAVLAEAARVARPGGRIAVVDFAAHDREELRERHAHARLGFSDEQMLALLSEAGFAPAPAIALPGRPLTVKIWTAVKDGAPAPVQLGTPAR